MTHLPIPATLDIDAAVAPALANPISHSVAESLVSRMLESASVERLLEVMTAISTEARKRGLTDEILNAELTANNAEHRERRPAG